MSETNTCPCCGRHCDLSAPHCVRGEEYLRTGKLPERGQEREGDEHGTDREVRGHWQDRENHAHHHERESCEHHHERARRAHMREEHYRNADTNDKLIMNIRDLSHVMHALYEGRASQQRILMILRETEPITQRDLTERLDIQPGSASEILSKLENAGLIQRTPNETDRRTTDVSLTDVGRERAAEALAQRKKRHEEMFSCLSEEEKQTLLSLLEKVSGDWRVRYRDKRSPHHGHFN